MKDKEDHDKGLAYGAYYATSEIGSSIVDSMRHAWLRALRNARGSSTFSPRGQACWEVQAELFGALERGTVSFPALHRAWEAATRAAPTKDAR